MAQAATRNRDEEADAKAGENRSALLPSAAYSPTHYRVDPDAEEILHLTATVSCASPPHNPVLSCSSCQTREAKRVAKKIAARVRPARSDSDSPQDPSNPTVKKSRYHEDTTSIIQFNCAEILDFSTGSVVLPLRITCYCRHHREKVGFLVHLTMMDHNGRIIGSGISRPIMITDDHKTTTGSIQAALAKSFGSPGMYDMDHDMYMGRELVTEHHAPDAKAPSKRTKEAPSGAGSKPRAKPYDGSTKRAKRIREASESSLPSPSTTHSPLSLTRSPTPPTMDAQTAATFAPSLEGHPSASQLCVDVHQRRNSSHESEASSDTLITPDDQSYDVAMLPPQQLYQPVVTNPIIPNILRPTTVMPSSQTLPLLFFDPGQSMSLPIPIIHRLIPNCGPTHGGVEVTILGANFHPTLQLNCVFGDTVASSTSRWSDNTLVCILPPRATAGIVQVWFDGIPKSEDPATSLSLFTYTDDSDRALMELALQVVGLKMTGKIEDAKNVAMRIVGNPGSDSSQSHNGMPGNMLQTSTSASSRDIRSLLFSRTSKTEDFETLITDFLSILDSPVQPSTPFTISSAISHSNASGQTLLHLAAFLGFNSLVSCLIRHRADLDARDRNGCTPLHLAAMTSHLECAKLLYEAGADAQIVNARGKTPKETASAEVLDDFVAVMRESTRESALSHGEDDAEESSEDDEARWGDGEEDSDDASRVPSRRAHHKRCRRRHRSHGPEDSTSHVDSLASDNHVGGGPLSDVKSDEKTHDLGKVDEKQAASFIDMIQRTFTTLQAPQGIIPNMPQLPLPQFRQLTELGIPAVPWNALSHIPVFPVFVPMPGWPSFRGKEHDAGDRKDESGDKKEAAQEWRTLWERWIWLASANAQHTEDMPPPEYTPRAEKPSYPDGREEVSNGESSVRPVPNEAEPEAGPSSLTPSRAHSSSDLRASSRRLDYSRVPVPDRDVNAYAYRPSSKQTQKIQKKHDKMLFSFWLPVLLLGILYLLYIGMQFAMRAARYSISPLKFKLGNLINL
ncbi:hypothetical protein HGRIS_002483 [Hohenbuehelia grisea]|uniref:IPT/TIG domain-containing protein n=1 Tax=Hohenbuehelia grisea TaxID=104357 RepID=A0ABR3JLB0_9AGAR